MVHLPALPGAPGFGGDLGGVIERATLDAEVLGEAGFDAVLVENYGDAPFFPGDVPRATLAAMTRCVAEVGAATALPVGVNVLRNDARAALAVAAATGAAFIRVNVLAGSMFTDQGLVVGRAAEVLRDRRALAPEVQIFADVFVKHATPPPGSSLEQAAEDTFERGGADALIVSGSATGNATDLADVHRIRKAVPEAPVLIGSGVTAATVADTLAVSDGVIVGTSLKRSRANSPIDARLAAEFVSAAGR